MRGTGLPERNTRFLIDTNVFIDPSGQGRRSEIKAPKVIIIKE